ncbi:mariner Mos1 transposase [Trichonephila clavata]|uniref:Mariner Mos1 transposase n=1 Tax=Trichonephila clavata TaxID=2740835 RepID=A0A8X6L847_TRICU|nr:mariner Mos1 transposase [Trichonephila clavata]
MKWPPLFFSSTNENVGRFREIVCVDRRIAIDDFATQLGISHDSVHSLLQNDLKMNKIVFVCTWFQKMLSPEQKEMRVNMSRDLIDMADEDDILLKKILTSDETWYFLNNPHTKHQSREKLLGFSISGFRVYITQIPGSRVWSRA